MRKATPDMDRAKVVPTEKRHSWFIADEVRKLLWMCIRCGQWTATPKKRREACKPKEQK